MAWVLPARHIDTEFYKQTHSLIVADHFAAMGELTK